MWQDTQLNHLGATSPIGHSAQRTFLRELPRVRYGALGFTATVADEQPPILVDSADWYRLLEEIASFGFEDELGNSFTARRERRQQQWYWYAYRKHGAKLRKVYLGKPQQLALARLQAAARELANLDLEPEAEPQSPLAAYTGHPAWPVSTHQVDGHVLRSTKLHVPAMPANLLKRPRLTHQLRWPLEEGSIAMRPSQPYAQALLTLITAPTGYGKSTVLSEWVQQSGNVNTGWLSLDPDDNDLWQFWRYVIAALQTDAPELGQRAWLLLEESQPLSIDDVVMALLTDLHHMPHAMVLVLDDYHVIDTPAIHDSLAVFLTHCPAHLHVLISSRTPLPLPIGRLRLRSAVMELQAAELRLTDEEGHALLSRDPHLARDRQAMAMVLDKTEGWVTGVCLFALALQHRTDLQTVLAEFDGTHRYLSEYFYENVWRLQNPTIQMFLLSTAILEHLTGSLCEAVTGLRNSQQMLTSLEQANLFLVAIDQRPGWYRYHPLFRQAIQGMLERVHPDEVLALHRRAAGWYLEQQAPGDALRHLVAGQSWNEAAQVLEQYAFPMLQRGDITALLRCLGQFPPAVLHEHPALMLIKARALMLAGEMNALEAWLEHLESSMTSESILEEVAAIRAIVSFGQRGAGTPVRESTVWESLDAFILSIRSWSHDEIEESYITAARAARAGQATGLRSASLLAAGTIACLHMVRGELSAAQRVAHDALAREHTTAAAVLAGSYQANAATGPLLMALGVIAYERNRLDQAHQCLEKAQELNERLGREDYLFATHLFLARTLDARGQRQQAQLLLKAGVNRAREGRSVFWPDVDILAYQAWTWLQNGEMALAAQWAQTAGLRIDDPQIARRKIEYWVYGEVLLAQGRYEHAAHILSQLAQSATEIGTRTEPLIKLLVSYATALFAAGQRTAALPVLDRALELGQPEGYIRPFLDSAPRHSRALLAYYQQKRRTEAHIEAYVQQLLAESVLVPLSMVESAGLRRREREILRLVENGLSNLEIANKLVIEVTTVKSHLQHIYQCLNVSSRHQAVQHAKMLQLL